MGRHRTGSSRQQTSTGHTLRLRTTRRRHQAESLPVAISEVLDDLADLRLHLATDLSLVAGAAAEDEPAVGAEILAADSTEVRAARARMAAALDGAELPRRRNRHLRPVLAAAGTAALGMAAALALVLGVPSQNAPLHSSPAAQSGISAARSSYAALLQAVLDARDSTAASSLGSAIPDGATASQVVPAANRLHRALEHLIASAPTNPGDAAVAARLLALEQQLLAQAQAPNVSALLAEAEQLSQRLRLVSPETAVLPVPAPAPSDRPAPSTAPSPTPAGTGPTQPTNPSGTGTTAPTSGTSATISVRSGSS